MKLKTRRRGTYFYIERRQDLNAAAIGFGTAGCSKQGVWLNLLASVLSLVTTVQDYRPR